MLNEKIDKNFYRPWHLKKALWLRSYIRRFSRNTKNYKHFLKLCMFLEVLFDINHQETFIKTIPNKYAQKDFKILQGFNVPQI